MVDFITVCRGTLGPLYSRLQQKFPVKVITIVGDAKVRIAETASQRALFRVQQKVCDGLELSGGFIREGIIGNKITIAMVTLVTMTIAVTPHFPRSKKARTASRISILLPWQTLLVQVINKTSILLVVRVQVIKTLSLNHLGKKSSSETTKEYNGIMHIL